MAKKEKKPETKPRGCPAWMMTFGDSMSLLLTFFVMLMSFTTFDEEKFKSVLGSMSFGTGSMSGDQMVVHDEELEKKTGIKQVEKKTDAEDADIMMLGYKKEDLGKEKSKKLMKEMRKELESTGNYDMIDFEQLVNGVSIRIQNAVLFDGVNAELKPQSTKVLEFFYPLFEALPNELIIEGHTDSRPVKTERFPSNWDLSAARATEVAEFFIAKGMDPVRFSVSALAETRPLVLPQFDSKNSRVEIIIKGLKFGELPDYARLPKEQQ